MKKSLVTAIALLTLLLVGLTAVAGCDAFRGAKVYIEGMSMAADGKPISGLPAQKANVALKVSVKEVSISTQGNNTIIKLNPAGATITVTPAGIALTGVKSDQIEIKWQTETKSSENK